jgi:hypothetical protein
VFLNSLLATLNGREALKERLGGVSEVVLSDISTRRVEYSSKTTYDSGQTSQASYPEIIFYNKKLMGSDLQPVLVSINRQVEVEDSPRSSTFPSKRMSAIPFDYTP